MLRQCSDGLNIKIKKEMILGLNNVKLKKGSYKPAKRRGRGDSTHGRGNKGQHMRGTVRPGFEGGQTPYYLRVKKNVRYKRAPGFSRRTKLDFRTYRRKLQSKGIVLGRKTNFEKKIGSVVSKNLVVITTDLLFKIISNANVFPLVINPSFLKEKKLFKDGEWRLKIIRGKKSALPSLNKNVEAQTHYISEGA